MTLYEQTRDDRERVLGIDHSDTLTSHNDLDAAQATGHTAEVAWLDQPVLDIACDLL